MLSNNTRVVVVRTYDCGCGFRTDDERNAIEHAFMTGHSMTVHGRVLAERQEEVPA